MKKEYLIGLAFLIIGSCQILLFAQNNDVKNNELKIKTIETGSQFLKTNKINIGTTNFILYSITNKDIKPVSFLTRKVLIKNQDLVIEQLYNSSVGGISSDRSILSFKSLSPIYYESNSEQKTEKFNFTPTKVQGQISFKEGKTTSINVDLLKGTFNAVVLDELVQTLPIRKGFKIRFRSYNPGKNIFNMTLEVVGEENITVINKRDLEVWVIEIKGGALPSKMWVTKKTQELIMHKTLLPNNREFWKVRTYR